MVKLTYALLAILKQQNNSLPFRDFLCNNVKSFLNTKCVEQGITAESENEVALNSPQEIGFPRSIVVSPEIHRMREIT